MTALLSMGAFLPVWAAEEAQGKTQGTGQTFVILGMALVFFYFILWRPEQKRRKQMDAQRSSMKVGDTVTAMGIVGVVASIQDKTVILTMVDGAKIEMLKTCITDVQHGAATDKTPGCGCS